VKLKNVMFSTDWIVWALLVVLAGGVIFFVAGIGAQVLVRLAWVVKKPFNPGDRVNIGGREGTVERLGWLNVHLRSDGIERVSIPNRSALRATVAKNISAVSGAFVEMRLALPEGTKPAVGRQVVWQAVAMSPYLDLTKPINISLEQGAKGEVAVKLKAAIFDEELRARFETAVIEAVCDHL
jgi:hypothetical protein